MRRRLKVRVDVEHGIAAVVLRRRGGYDYKHALVGKVNLAQADADERLSEIRMKAKDMCRQLNDLEN